MKLKKDSSDIEHKETLRVRVMIQARVIVLIQ